MVLVFFMDGVKYDMMKKYMPFLSSINSKPLLSEFGYSCACHATMYTSKYIEEHGTWFIWKKGNNSPYKWINYIPGLKYINFLPLKLLIGKITRKFSKNSSYGGVSCLVNLPLKYWSLFEPCDNVLWNNPKWKENIPNMFTILEENKIKNSVVALHNNTKRNDAWNEECIVDYEKDQFAYYFIGYTDNIMHQYGEDAIESQNYLKEVDSFIEKTYQKAKQYSKEVKIIAFSDHGHINIEDPKININDYFKLNNDNVNKYIHLIESNYARFWFRNEQERNKVEKVIKMMIKDGLGFIIDEKYKEEYHLNVNPKEHGELIFYLRAPKEFTNTIWGFGHSVKSGHGYEPTLKKHYGIFCSNLKIKDGIEFIHLVDILPTITSLLKINDKKYSFHGRKVLVSEKGDEE